MDTFNEGNAHPLSFLVRHGFLLARLIERTTRRQHAANMLSPGQGSPDPVRAYHAHWAKCAVGEAAPAFILAGEAIEPGVTVVWGVHWGGHPPA